MLTRSAGHLSAPFTLLLAATCLRSSLSFPAASFTMAAQDVAASGAVTPAVDAAAPCIVEAKGFEDPVLKKSRSITMALESKWQGEGVGARVRRSIGRYELPNLDPFLMLDEFSVGKPAGFPDHPHRGFETVTYMLEGKFTHEDFKGHSGTIGPGDLQWMTAGKGIMHSEVPADDSQSHGLQLWVNLAAEHKMTEPAYQELLAKDIPKVQHAGVVATVIAGEAFGVKSPVYTRTPTMYLDFTMEPGSTLHQAIPQGWNGFAYVLSGSADFNSTLGKAHHTLVLTAEEGEDGLTVTAPADAPVHFVLICGKPLGEPIVQHGPFVMNTKAEIQQAMRDFHSGTNGFEGAAQWASEGGKTFR